LAWSAVASAETPEIPQSTVVASTEVVISSPVIPVPTPPAVTPGVLTMLHPTENQKLPMISQVFAYGQVTPGSTLTINGLPVNVHPKGGYITMVPLISGDQVLNASATAPSGATTTLQRRVSVNVAPPLSRAHPATIERASIKPDEEWTLMAGDILRVSFQGSPNGQAEFLIESLNRRIPMAEVGGDSMTGRGFYQGSYVVQPEDRAVRATVEVALKKSGTLARQKAAGRLTIEAGSTPRMAVITDEAVAVRTAADGGYDFFLYKGMKVRLTGKSGAQTRVRVSSVQSGWVKDTALSPLPLGTPVPQSVVGTIQVNRQAESTLIRVPLTDLLAYRAEQSIDPMQLTVTIYGAAAKMDLIKYDPSDTLIRQVRWRQIAPDALQLIIEPRFDQWWGYDVRYEGNTLVVEVREPWHLPDLKGMPIAVDAGHGGSDSGAQGTLGTLEKNTNLAVARAVKTALEEAGAKPFMIRDSDMEVPLADRGKIAWKSGARLFISMHANSSGPWGNPVWNNGYSIYFYHPQSKGLAESLHTQYRRHLSLADFGLYYADLAVCRITQMPSILTEQAYIIVPEQEQLLLDPAFHRKIGDAVVAGIKKWLKP